MTNRDVQKEKQVVAQLSYWVLEVKDMDRAVDFYGSVFGWTFSEPRPSGGRRIWDTEPWGGLAPLPVGVEPSGRTVIELVTDDIAATAELVRQHGGTVQPVSSPFGQAMACIDDQGTHFALFVPGDDSGT
jgi:predicted enzyme related to lactoylglutathione lyase